MKVPPQLGSVGVDVSNCDREPIRIPGAIQPHGFLVAFDPELRLRHASANAESFFGCRIADLFGRTVTEVFAPAVAAALKEASVDPAFAQRPLFLAHARCHRGESLYALVGHRWAGSVVVEGELISSDAPDLGRGKYDLAGFLTRMETADSVGALLTIAAQETRNIIGFDRVLIYQFDPDWNGVVVAEDRNDRLPSYLGLRFPASDIPRQARELYSINRLRLIQNADYTPVPIEARDGTGEQLDLSLSTLRSVSPVHLEYMRNMGTGSSMSISLLRGGRLWGLISCHNRDTGAVPFDRRATSELIGQMLSLQLAAQEQTSRLTYRMKLNAALTRLMAAMSVQQDVTAALCGQAEDLLAVTNSTGAAIVIQQNIELIGVTPTKTQVADLVTWLHGYVSEVCAFDHLQDKYPQGCEFTSCGSGVLAISLSRVHANFILWFRPEIVSTVRWAGNPAKPVEVSANQPPRLHPRKSFEAWAESVRGRSAPWQPAEVDIARDMRGGITEIVLQNAERLAGVTEQLARTSKELETISYTISHDLRAPLRAMYGYADSLLQDAAARLLSEDIRRLKGISHAAHRLDRMIRAVLRYSHVSRMDIQSGVVELHELVHEVIASEPLLAAHGDRIEFAGLMPQSVTSSRELLEESIRALLINAVKFVPSERLPRVQLRTEQRAENLRLWCEDNGCGITPEFQDRVFAMFERLHAGQDAEGNGVGLAIVKRAITRLGGEVGVESTPGEGSRFWIDLPHL